MSDTILILDQQGNMHLCDFANPYGKKYTICHRFYDEDEILTTLALDEVIDLVCEECRMMCKYDMRSEANPRQKDSVGIGLRIIVAQVKGARVPRISRLSRKEYRNKKIKTYLRKVARAFIR
jgi:hypothetical protein